MERARSILIGLLVLAIGARVSYAFDLTGTWVVSIGGSSACADFVQSGSALTVSLPCGSTPLYTGTVTGQSFSVTQPPSGCVLLGPGYCDLNGTVALDGDSFTGNSDCFFFKVTPPAGCFSFSQPASGAREHCGDGFLNPATEACDDGNTANGDCCSSTCTLEPDGQSCDDGSTGTINDSCSGGACRGTALPGVEFVVNSYTPGTQRFPDVACDAQGDFLIAWQDEAKDGSGAGVFAQRYASDGARLGAEFQVNSYTTQQQMQAAVSLDAGGGALIAWESFGQDGDANGVFARRFDSAGTPLGAEFQVNSFTVGSQEAPAVAHDGAGNAIVV
jgi:cysteine-rich repeat protein